MDFFERADKAYERGEAVRAVVMLVEGLKRQPDHDAAAERVCEIFADSIDRPGLEEDLVAGLVGREDAEDRLTEVAGAVRGAGRTTIADRLERSAAREGLELDARAERDRRRNDRPAASAGEQPAEPEPAEAEPETDAGIEERAEQDPGTRDSDAPAEDGQTRTGPTDTDRSEGTSTDELNAERRRWGWAGLVVVVAGIAAWGLVQWTESTSSYAGVDQKLAALDVSAPKPVRRALEDLQGPELRRAGIRERRQFLEAAVALRNGETLRFEGDPQTRWGWAAVGMAALTRGDLEAAERAATRLERTRPEGDLVRLWLRGRVDEARGQLSGADAAYQRGGEAHPEFLPFRIGRLRIAARRMDAGQIQSIVEELRSKSEAHPYLEMAAVRWPDLLSTSAEGAAPNLEIRGPFGVAMRAYIEAYRRLRGGDWAKAEQAATRALEADSGLSAARWVRAAARASQFDATGADADFRRLTGAEGLGARRACRLHVVAPRMLTAIGRADLAAQYHLRPEGTTRMGGGDGSDGEGAAVLPPGRFGDADCEEAPASLRRRAWLESVRTAANYGDLKTARAILEAVDASEGEGALRRRMAAEVAMRSGRRPAGVVESSVERAEPGIRLMQRYLSGQFERVVDEGEGWLEAHRGDTWVVRWVALALAETGRGRRAMQAVRRSRFAPVAIPVQRRLRTRLLARLANGSAAAAPEAGWLEAETVHGVDFAIDAAAIALWSAGAERAEALLKRAYEPQPEHPGVNWWRGVLLRARGKRREAGRYLRKSWRAESGGGNLAMALGYVNLSSGHNERAAEAFFRALLARPKSVAAIRGLGRSYARWDPDKGAWNFKRILENYDRSGDDVLYAGEVLRWMGVFAGSRRGKKAGLERLEQAREVTGRRPVILLELGRYHQARGDWTAARRFFVEALEKNSTLAPAHLGLAEVADELSNPRAARTHLRRYLTLEPTGSRREWAAAKLEAIGRQKADPGDDETTD